MNQMQMLVPDGSDSGTLVALVDMLHPVETMLALADSDSRHFHTVGSGDHATLGCMYWSMDYTSWVGSDPQPD